MQKSCEMCKAKLSFKNAGSYSFKKFCSKKCKSKSFKIKNPKYFIQYNSSSYMTNYRVANKEKINSKQRERYHLLNKKDLYQRKRHLWCSFKLTLEMYEKMRTTQNSKCAICGILEKDINHTKGSNLYVDHCHSTKKIRGLLCPYCNLGLGAFKDNISNMQKAIDYLGKI